MSDNQLGWDQLLLNKSAENTPENTPVKTSEKTSTPDSNVNPESAPSRASANQSAEMKQSLDVPAELQVPDKVDTETIKTSRKRKKSPPKSSFIVGEKNSSETLYAKKNWSKLEFKKSPPAPVTEVIGAPTGADMPEKKLVGEQNLNRRGVTSAQSNTGDVFANRVQTPARAEEQSEVEPEVLSVTDLNKSIREILEGRFPLIWVKGEISNFKAHTSGHFYFSLKDAKAQISAVMFRGFNSQLKFLPEDGMEVVVRGKITVYEPRGNYQIFCEVMEPIGAGALQKAYEQLKAKLQAEGLFETTRKRPLPTLPRHIVIVTSPTGAAIRDMLNVLSRRFKGADITLIPCKVQGDAAPREICAAIELANRLQDVDVMIVGRGGGSIEDLWAFNDEKVARAIANAKVPVISAVGHEVDFTIADFVADLRAPTPSAAAELVVKNAADLIERIGALAHRLRLAILGEINMIKQKSEAVARRLVDPQRSIQDAMMRCDELLQRLQNRTVRLVAEKHLLVAPLNMQLRLGIRNILGKKRELVARRAAVLDSLSPLRVLDRGYSMIVSNQRVVTKAGELKVDQEITVRMSQGSVEAKVTKVFGGNNGF